MATPKPFPHAGFLHDLKHTGAAIQRVTATSLSPSLACILLTADGGPSIPVVTDLIELLKARKAVLQASLDGELVAKTRVRVHINDHFWPIATVP